MHTAGRAENMCCCVLYALGCRIPNKRQQQQQLNTLRMSSRPTSGYSLCALYYRICCYELCTLNAVRIGTDVREQLEHCMHWTGHIRHNLHTHKHTNIKTTQVEELACMQHTHTLTYFSKRDTRRIIKSIHGNIKNDLAQSTNNGCHRRTQCLSVGIDGGFCVACTDIRAIRANQTTEHSKTRTSNVHKQYGDMHMINE